MPYDPYSWKDSKAGGTPITAARLNAIEQGIDRVADVADSASVQAAASTSSLDSIRGSLNDLTSKINSTGVASVQTLSSSVDMNTVKATGYYRWGGDGTWGSSLNTPKFAYPFGLFVVSVSGASIAQNYIPDGANGLWTRSTWNGTFSTWQHFSNDTQATAIAYAAADDRLRGTALNVLQFGAKGDGVTDDRVAIQTAIDQAKDTWNSTGSPQEVYFPGRIFRISMTGYYNSAGQQYGATGLVLHTGVRLIGSGTIKFLDSSRGAGTLGAVIRSDASGISDAGIYGLKIDGNRSKNVSSDQCSNIVLNVSSGVTIQNVTSYEADGEGIQILPPDTGGVASSVKILNNRVSNCDRIGIQVSHFNDLLIDGNSVQYCGNNSIDIYGDINGNQTGDGSNFIITNNYTDSGLSGIFPETVRDGIVANNRCVNMQESGIHVNRSWSQVSNVQINNNTMSNCQFGILFTGDMSGVMVRGNYIWGANQAGIKLGQDGYRCSNVYVIDNFINTNVANATPLVLFTGPQVAYCRVRGTITTNTDRFWDNVFYNLGANVGNTVSAANAT